MGWLVTYCPSGYNRLKLTVPQLGLLILLLIELHIFLLLIGKLNDL